MRGTSPWVTVALTKVVLECHPLLGHHPMASEESWIYIKTSVWPLSEEHGVCISYWYNWTGETRPHLHQMTKVNLSAPGQPNTTQLWIHTSRWSQCHFCGRLAPNTQSSFNEEEIAGKSKLRGSMQISLCILSKCHGHGRQSLREPLYIKEGSMCNS